jgi:hypothetical protein
MLKFIIELAEHAVCSGVDEKRTLHAIFKFCCFFHLVNTPRIMQWIWITRALGGRIIKKMGIGVKKYL